MSGICGWIKSPPEAATADVVLNAMAARLNGSEPVAAATTDACALAGRAGPVPVAIARIENLSVAVEGRVQWRTEELTRIAAAQGNAAALASAWRALGTECLQDIHGPFAVALLDTGSGDGLLAIDRIGIRTMCYARTPEGLVFGSTADSVAAHPAVGRSVSSQAIFNYLYCHMVPSPGTIFRGIDKLLPGQCLELREGSPTRRFYWHLHYSDGDRASTARLAERFRGLLRDAAGRALGADKGVGAFLSGGTDSSTVTGLLGELSGAPAETYSIGFSAEGFDEMDYARITAKHFGAHAHEYYVTPQDVVDAIPILAAAYDEPFGNASAVPTYFCAKMARADGVKTLLAGDGGDEIFGGNARYAKQKVFEYYWSVPAGMRRAIVEPVAMAIPGAGRIAPLRKMQSYIRQASVPLPDRLEAYNFLHRSPLTEVFEPAFLADVDQEEPLSLQREVYHRADATSPVDRMMHLDLKFTLADNDLRKVSRMCDVAGVEVRYPLLDEALVEFSGELAPSLKVRGLKLRYFFKDALRDFLPAETLTKSKHGFGMPFGLWLRDYKPLAELVHADLNAFKRRGIVRSAYIDDLVHQHETGHATYYGVMIWVIMTLERWMQARNL